MVYDFYDFLNESRMDKERSFLLFSDTIRQSVERVGDIKYNMFSVFYDEPESFYALSLIDPVASITRISNITGQKGERFTLLKAASYQDNTLGGRNNLPDNKIREILADKGKYYFYDIIKGKRIHGDDIDESGNFPIVHGNDNEDWYFIIKKDINCSLVKTKSRQESGELAEIQSVKLYGWELQKTGIILKKFKKGNDVITRTNNFLKTILNYTDEDFEQFSVEESTENTYSKYDLLIDGQYRIEVKKYFEKDIWSNRSKLPIGIVLAEQFKIADLEPLRKLVEWYYELTGDVEAEPLLNMGIRLMKKEFDRGRTPSAVVTRIRNEHNTRILRMLKVLQNVDEKVWMKGFSDQNNNGIYGIFFVPDPSRKFDFLIRLDGENRNSVKCVWDKIDEWGGLIRLKLILRVSGSSMEYILSDNNQFLEAYKLEDYGLYKNGREKGIIKLKNGITYIFNDTTKRWNIKNNEEL